jgi:L-ascorbate metabolism protein UlaG (beta-lactamase superfamily)
MKIKHFLYNAFIVEHEETRVAIDPGQSLWLFGLRSLIPKGDWPTLTHVLVTHGDPDHYWQADRVAQAAKAPMVLGAPMVRHVGSTVHILAPRRRGLQFVPYDGPVYPLNAGESVKLNGVEIEGLRTTHGPIEFRIFGRRKRQSPGPDERVGFGSIGYRIRIDETTFVNVGDSVLQEEWAGLRPDVLMLPIGGLGNRTWTMDAAEAVEAVRLIRPKHVIPCHYSVPFFLNRHMCPADALQFKRQVEQLGVGCTVLTSGEEFEVPTAEVRQPQIVNQAH